MADAATFVERFDHVVATFPLHPAIEYDGRFTLSYSQLRDRSLTIAAAILDTGLSAQSVVAISLSKSPDYVASLLAVWRAGCIALPLPDELPVDRQLDYLARCRCQLTLNEAFLAQVPLITNATRTCKANSPHDLAYIVFTSGSTGKPKGVAVEHRGYVPMLAAQVEAFQLDSHSRSLFYLSLAFDASLSDIGTILMAGGSLVIESDLHRLSVRELMQRISERQVTYADLPPAVMTHAARQHLQAPACLQTVVVGGEVCPLETARYWASRLRLVNVYGPTEATICSSLTVVQVDNWTVGSIGNPIAGSKYHIERFAAENPAEGELWISGPGLARGYWDDIPLTDKKFVSREGQRWYRTGDRVAISSQGEVIFKGRLDRQFKLQGKLIEPAEIEQALRDLDGVAVAVVVPIHADEHKTSSITSIAALVQSAGDVQLSSQDVAAKLHRQLPPWMVPSQIQIVDHIPTSLSGKPDMPAVNRLLNGITQPKDPAGLHSSQALALRSIWETALGKTIDWDDDFFMIGGDSLAALQILAQAQAHSIPMSLPLLHQARTIRNCLAADEIISAGMTTQQLRRELQSLVNQLPPRRTGVINHPSSQRHYLLTGATGFLGTRVLDRLRRETGATVTCIVRASTPELARLRIAIDDESVEVMCGDISQPCWGLTCDEWKRLCTEVTDVINLAAEVHLLRDFYSLAAVNVQAVASAIELVTSGNPKRLHHASTLSVFVATDRRDRCFYETDRLAQDAVVYGGYAQSKWAAEQLLWQQFATEDPRLAVYRFGLLTGDSTAVRGVTGDQLALFTRGLAQLGVFPAGCDELCFDVTPIDAAAAVMSQLIGQTSSGAFHVCGKRSISLREWINAMLACDIPLQEVPAPRFLQAVQQSTGSAISVSVATACLSLCRRLVRDENLHRQRELDLFLMSSTTFDSTHTDTALRGTGVSMSAVDQSMLIKTVRAIQMSSTSNAS